MVKIKSVVANAIQKTIRVILPIKYQNRPRVKRMLVRFFFEYWRFLNFGKKINPYSIPIVINNYNRLTCLVELIQCLTDRGYYNIHIIDNKSTYKPLIDYYKTLNYPIYYLAKNVGYKAIWETGLYKKFWTGFYVYTDSDVVLDKECPNNFIDYLIEIMYKYKNSQKIGLGIHIDDLPDTFAQKTAVIKHEKEFWEKEIEPNVFVAPVDTTFALYKPFGGSSADGYQFVLRTGFPYMIHHKPWYIDSQKLSEEDLFYINSLEQSTHWSRLVAQ